MDTRESLRTGGNGLYSVPRRHLHVSRVSSDGVASLQHTFTSSSIGPMNSASLSRAGISLSRHSSGFSPGCQCGDAGRQSSVQRRPTTLLSTARTCHAKPANEERPRAAAVAAGRSVSCVVPPSLNQLLERFGVGTEKDERTLMRPPIYPSTSDAYSSESYLPATARRAHLKSDLARRAPARGRALFSMQKSASSASSFSLGAQ